MGSPSIGPLFLSLDLVPCRCPRCRSRERAQSSLSSVPIFLSHVSFAFLVSAMSQHFLVGQAYSAPAATHIVTFRAESKLNTNRRYMQCTRVKLPNAQPSPISAVRTIHLFRIPPPRSIPKGQHDKLPTSWSNRAKSLQNPFGLTRHMHIF